MRINLRLTKLEVEVVRVRITLACTECKQRNYNTTKEKKNHPERLRNKKVIADSVESILFIKKQNKSDRFLKE